VRGRHTKASGKKISKNRQEAEVSHRMSSRCLSQSSCEVHPFQGQTNQVQGEPHRQAVAIIALAIRRKQYGTGDVEHTCKPEFIPCLQPDASDFCSKQPRCTYAWRSSPIPPLIRCRQRGWSREGRAGMRAHSHIAAACCFHRYQGKQRWTLPARLGSPLLLPSAPRS
jgi:hypothetical protein